jgi:hypothetical protein
VTTRNQRTALAAAVVASTLLAWGCSKLDSPTHPDPTPLPGSPVATSAPNPGPTPTPVLGGPKPNPSPSPSPGTSPDDPTASPTPAPAPEGATDCGSPLPPELSRINLNIHQRGDSRWILDSTPIVGPDADYCAKIGFTDGRSFCPVRAEGDPERTACELYVTGRAQDTGRPGPTWSVDGKACTGPPGCENNSDNQYQVFAYQAGFYKVCGNKNDICGEIVVDR